MLCVNMVFENPGNRLTNSHFLLCIAKQVTNEADFTRTRQFNKHNQVRTLFGERGVHWMPHSFKTVDQSFGLSLFEVQVKSQAVMADPLRPPLPFATGSAPLQQ